MLSTKFPSLYSLAPFSLANFTVVETVIMLSEYLACL